MNGEPSKSRGARGVALAALLAAALCFTTHPSAQAPSAASAPIDLKVVIHERGFFRDRGNGDWTEHGPNGMVIFNFREERRTASAVFLRDERRKLSLELNPGDKAIFFTDATRNRAKLIGIRGTRSAQTAGYFQVRSQVTGSGTKCLQAVALEGGVYSAELMEPCDESPAQLWNVAPGQAINDTPTFRWRNMLTQMRGVDLCLQSKAANAPVTLATCNTREEQRWVHPPPTASASLKPLRTIAVKDRVCMGHKKSTEGAPRWRKDKDDVTTKDVEFWLLQMVYCGTGNDSGSNNDPLWYLLAR